MAAIPAIYPVKKTTAPYCSASHLTLHTEVHGLLGWWFFDCRQDPGPASLGQTVGYWCIKALPSDGVSGSATQIKKREN